jgi:hypothetical protein
MRALSKKEEKPDEQYPPILLGEVQGVLLKDIGTTSTIDRWRDGRIGPGSRKC